MKNKKRTLAGCMLICFALTAQYEPEHISAHVRTDELPAYSAAGHAYSTTAQMMSRSNDTAGQEDAAPKIKYTIEEDKLEYKDKNGIVRGLVSFSYPQFIGSSPVFTKINEQLKKKSQKFLTSGNAATIAENTAYAIDNHMFYDKYEQFYWKTLCDVSYDKNGIISFCMSEQWYAGGVHNQNTYGLNYDLTTGKKLTINDVISGNARKKILRAAKKYCGQDATAYAIIKETKKFNFFLYKGDVCICFGSYALGHGTSWDEFTVKGSYS